ncbi:antitoxin Xre/MbcA/ParS toxin-binding domain-containing protein [uncultured Methylobacterium sp.]|uniref:type II RES/Xre toxin-antitoxin system antitoxin n=1 Tax=uncultured Methylobacterium sp. TaxID=157278 RepID=UPI0035C9E857
MSDATVKSRGRRAPAAATAITKRSPAAPSPFRYVDIFHASPTERIKIIKSGVPASKAKRLITDLHFDQRVLLGALNLKTATVNRKAARNEALSPEDGERVIGIAKLVGQLEAMLQESGGPGTFDGPAWLSQWLREPVPSLGGVKPIGLLDTMEGQSLVSQALAQIQSGAYA